MTPQKKPSRAETIRLRRSPQTPNPDSAGAGEHGQAGKRIPAKSRQTSRTSAQRTSTSRQAYRPASVFLPVEPRPIAPTTLRRMKDGSFRRTSAVNSTTRSMGNLAQRGLKEKPGSRKSNSRKNGYEFAFSLGHTAVRAPLVSLPNLGSRWVSAGLTLLLGLMLFTMATANSFKVTTIELTGIQNLDTNEVSASLGLIGQPIYKAVPSKIVSDLRTTYPDLAGVSVNVGFPNNLRIAVEERVPLLIWHQDGDTKWIDSNGVEFPVRSDLPGLVQIISNGNPPKPEVDKTKSSFNQPFIAPAVVQAILALYPQVPSGAPMVFDPKYGLGWKDPLGWSVYFGQNTEEIEAKKRVYQAILDNLSQQGIQPTLVSVAYLDAPFYK